MKEIEIAGRKVGPGHPVFIVAEAGVNHNGSFEMAKQLVDIAAGAGADAVKFQTFKAEKLVAPQAHKAPYQLKTTDPNESQLEMLKRLELSFDAFREINSYCQEKGILFFSTPFDEESTDFLDELGVPVFKMASGEITNWPFLQYVARKRKPIILSTGMSYLSEVDEAVRVIRNEGNDQLVLLHCVSNYPADPADANLRAINTMISAFNVPVGYSDHTAGVEIALAAVALGACIIEKHFTLNKNLHGPDHKTSLERNELANMTHAIRTVESGMGNGIKKPRLCESEVRILARRSLVARADIPRGTVLSRDIITAKRPGNGLSPRELSNVIGKIAQLNIPKDTAITKEMLK